MAHYTAAVIWERGEARFNDNRYSRVHLWRFDGGAEVDASSSPHVVPIPFSDPTAINPEEAFVASLSSCHMLWFLHIAAKQGFVVERYEDQAVGVMAQDDAGKQAMTRVTLYPEVQFAAGSLLEPDDIVAMHHEAHENCYIARSVKTEVCCEPIGLSTDHAGGRE